MNEGKKTVFDTSMMLYIFQCVRSFYYYDIFDGHVKAEKASTSTWVRKCLKQKLSIYFGAKYGWVFHARISNRFEQKSHNIWLFINYSLFDK